MRARARNHDLADRDLDAAEQAWDQYWAAVRPVELTAAVEQPAGRHGAHRVHDFLVCSGPGRPYLVPLVMLMRSPWAKIMLSR
jgi:hypothetical protein